ncbi:MAG: hypothetical protein JSR66_17255 [Proteobacteria bacterium]|nr:hypothetical protein [Pseudomonadota bacterium]
MGWLGAEGVDPIALERILQLAQRAGFFESTWDSNYCAGVVLRDELGVLCVLDDSRRAPLTDGQRDLLGMLGNQVVEHHELHRAVRKLRPLGHLARGIAHDMNNVLQTIIGSLNTVDKLIETDNLERTPRFLAAGLRAAQRAGELSRSLQRLAPQKRAGSGAVELNSFIGSLRELFQRIGGERITVRIQLADAAASVDCDAGELEGTLLTAVLEAAELIPDRGEILITTRKEASFVWVCVQERCLRLPAHRPPGM